VFLVEDHIDPIGALRHGGTIHDATRIVHPADHERRIEPIGGRLSLRQATGTPEGATP
jgi:hypothetical protein